MAIVSGAVRASHPTGSLNPGERILHCGFTTGTAGVIVASSVRFVGGTVTKTATKTGRYTIQFTQGNDKCIYTNFENLIGTVVGPADVAFTTAKGILALPRVLTNLATTGTMDVQFVRSDTLVDTEVQDAAAVRLTFFLSTAKYR